MLLVVCPSHLHLAHLAHLVIYYRSICAYSVAGFPPTILNRPFFKSRSPSSLIPSIILHHLFSSKHLNYRKQTC
ncbi:hypothetical protein SODALDRAFT_204369 [Sodiomyces alkalinus F11]|uniref:Uncharacterized protein n=1 Tax=Sodiomyces alkalinus (strain CBS 110278 / VKM F-3762 / F11) TaxID=1314773 RepID=A0A3N2PT81_SODAK|nr:hypothetical protein SODALDRAFT_204369 [Sodiomyces alkalinus F11]ROT37732.1 hypothetical protein SODALDRAFT_204369 [Sodiomyces alkalinus F11]